MSTQVPGSGNHVASDLLGFPCTPHLCGSAGTTDDWYLNQMATNRVLASACLVQEKMDGVNLGLHLAPDGSIVAIQKTRVLGKYEFAQFPAVYGWCVEHSSALMGVLAQGLAIFGEYLPPSPTTSVTDSAWIVFDVLELPTHQFLSHAEVGRRLTGLPVRTVPPLFHGIPGSIEFLQDLIRESQYSKGRMEGLYLRIEDSLYLRERCKFVRAGYVKGDRGWLVASAP